MRVDAPISFPENVQPSKVANSGSPTQQNRSAPIDSNRDQAQLSIDGGTIQSLKATVAQVPEVRQARVDALRQAIGTGSYHVSDQQLSDAMGSELLGQVGA